MDFTPLGKPGPDVSFYQDVDSTPQKIDFQKMKQAGAEFVICRAGQNSWPDEDFKDYWAAAKVAQIPRGSYWFYDSRNDPHRQALIWKAQIGTDYPEVGLWLDLEESYNGQYKGEIHWKTMIQSVRSLFPSHLKIGIYTANWWWTMQNARDNDYWAQFPLWISEYTENPLYIIRPKPWAFADKKPVLWQFTDSGPGLIYGVESKEIDLNYASYEFYSMFNLPLPVDQPQEEPGENNMFYSLTVLTAYLNGRETPGGNVNFPSGATFQTGFRSGDKLTSDLVQNNWYRIIGCERNGSHISIPTPVWAYAGSTNGYLRLDGTSTTIPDTEPVQQLPDEFWMSLKEDMSDKQLYRKVVS